MSQSNPFDQFDAPSPGVMVKPADPRRQYEAPLAQAELQSRAATLAKTQLETEALRQRMAQESPDGAGVLPRDQMVKALIDGRMAFPGGAALRSPYWQNLLGEVAKQDPSFDAVNYNSRAKTRADFTSGKSAQNIKALNTALGHLGQLNDQIGGTASHNFTPLNSLINGALDVTGDPGPGLYNQTAGAVSSELTQVFRGSGGAEADVKRYLGELSPSASQAQKEAAVRNIAGLLRSRLEEIGNQYQQGMGKSTDPIKLLNPHAQKVFNALAPAQDDGGAGGGPPSSGGGPGFTPGNGGGGGLSLTTGDTQSVADPMMSAKADRFDTLVHSGAPASQIRAFAKEAGAISPGDVDDAIEYQRKNPSYRGPYMQRFKDAPVSGLQSAANAVLQNPVGTALASGVDAFTGGNLTNIGTGFGTLGNRDVAQAGLEGIRKANPLSGGFGDFVGTVGGALTAERALGGVAGQLGGMASRLAPAAADTAFGALAGAHDTADHSAAYNSVIGGASALGGRLAGNLLAAPVAALARTAPVRGMFGAANNAVRGLRGAAPVPLNPLAAPLSAGDNAIYQAAQKAGIPDIQSRLADAQQLGVPMALADTHPALTSLAGAAVRRSPTADAAAQAALIPRARGQIDRFGNAVTRDLGPVGNIPQISADMTQQARTAAGPLYDRAYQQPVVSTPELDATLGTPFGRQALGRAQTIAANERRVPSELGFAQDAQGNTMLNPMPNQAIANHLSARDELDAAQQAYRAAKNGTGSVDAARSQVEAARQKVRDAEQGLRVAPDPSMPASVPGYTTQTLDYVKRGMDDVLEQHRNPITGRLQLDEAGRAQNQVKNQFLSEVDRLNPDYGQARATYAGPVQSRDALARGQDAFTLHPDELAMQVANQSPEHLGQMQLGYRDSLMGAANRVRYSSNPFDATLGTPVAEQRLSTLYPNNPGVPNLLRQRDMENGLARTSSDILGNSKTAQRGIADQAFKGDDMLSMAGDIGINLATGQVPTGAVFKGLTSQGLKDAVRFGLGKRAVAKADAIAPTLFNTDPAASAAALSGIVDSAQAYRDLIARSRQNVRAPLGMFGGSIGALLASQ